MSTKEAAEDTVFLNKSLTINQAWNHYTKLFLVNYKDTTTGKVKAKKKHHKLDGDNG